MRELVGDGAASKWFFVRYADPHFHIRVRALATNKEQIAAIGNVVAKVGRNALADGLCWNVCSEGYDREVGRYGGVEAISICESLFHIDSEVSIDMLEFEDGSIAPSDRWVLAYFYIDMLLDGFAIQGAERRALLENVAKDFKNEFWFGSRQKVQLGMKYRSFRPVLDKVVFCRDKDYSAQEKILGVLGKYKERISENARLIRSLEEQGSLTAEIENILRSLLHMHCNRFFSENQRRHEVVFYDFLERVQASISATRVAG